MALSFRNPATSSTHRLRAAARAGRRSCRFASRTDFGRLADVAAPQMKWCVEHHAPEESALQRSDSHPDQLRSASGDRGVPIVRDDLQVVRDTRDQSGL